MFLHACTSLSSASPKTESENNRPAAPGTVGELKMLVDLEHRDFDCHFDILIATFGPHATLLLMLTRNNSHPYCTECFYLGNMSPLMRIFTREHQR